MDILTMQPTTPVATRLARMRFKFAIIDSAVPIPENRYSLPGSMRISLCQSAVNPAVPRGACIAFNAASRLPIMCAGLPPWICH
jgi:hypothetical protein